MQPDNKEENTRSIPLVLVISYSHAKLSNLIIYVLEQGKTIFKRGLGFILLKTLFFKWAFEIHNWDAATVPAF